MDTRNNANNIYDCIVIGAGAAGLFYAAAESISAESISAADPPARNLTARNLILEKTARPGQKLLMSGSGMCNITHGGSIKDFIDKYGAHGRLIRKNLYSHNNLELMAMMESLGVPLMMREDGKVFPASMKAKDVLDTLLSVIANWQLMCDAEVVSIKILPQDNVQETVSDPFQKCAPEPIQESTPRPIQESIPRPIQESAQNGLAVIALTGGRTFLAKKLVIATGGSSYPSTGSDGSFFDVLRRDLDLEIVTPRPALAPVYVQDYEYGELSGISFEDVEVSCEQSKKIVTRGPMLLTHRGFSGPAILHISQYVQPGMLIRINYLPHMNTEQVKEKIRADRAGNNTSAANYIAAQFGLPKAFAVNLCSVLDQSNDGIEPGIARSNKSASGKTSSQKTDPAKTNPGHSKKLSQLNNKDVSILAARLTAHEYSVSGTGGWNDAMVTAGGVALDQIDLKTMRLVRTRRNNGSDQGTETTCDPLKCDIRIIGEALDINGDTGGYNLQFAYSSAMAAL